MKFVHCSCAFLAATLLLAGCGGASVGSGSPPSNPSPPPTPQLAITTASIPNAQVGTPYSVQLAAANGTGALTWSTTGLLPPGVTLSSSGVLSGTPTTPVCGASVPIKVTDSSSPTQTATASFSFSSEGWGNGMSQGQIGTYYHGAMTVDCGIDPISWTLVSGSLPAGIQTTPAQGTGPNADAQLLIQGMPTQSGTFNITLAAKDANFQFQTSVSFTILPAPLKLTDALMQIGAVGQPFDHTVSVAGGTPPYSFAVTSGSLPAGLQLNATTGEIKGTPQSAGVTQFTVTLADASNTSQFTIRKPDTILVTAAPLPSRNDTIAAATPISPGTYYASLSPYTDGSGNAAPDQDYYVLSGVNAGETYEVGVSNGYESWNGTYSAPTTSAIDPALELVDANGNRLATCNDPVVDSPPSGAPYSAGAKNFTDPCMSHSPAGPGSTTSYLDLQTSTANQKFYIHIFDFNGRARPDFTYTFTVTKK